MELQFGIVEVLEFVKIMFKNKIDTKMLRIMTNIMTINNK
jgi:hypothetical protein